MQKLQNSMQLNHRFVQIKVYLKLKRKNLRNKQVAKICKLLKKIIILNKKAVLKI